MQPNANRNSWLLTLLLVGAGAIYLGAAFVPARRAIGQLEQHLQRARHTAMLLSSPVSEMEHVRVQYAATTAYTDEWGRRLPSELELPGVLGEINRIAQEAGVATERFDPEHPIGHDALSEAALDIRVAGDFTQIGQFLQRLETLERFVWVEDLTLQSDRETRGKLWCEVKLVVFADYRDIFSQSNLSGRRY